MNDDLPAIATELSNLTEGDCAVILIGSAARGCREANSDIDVLLIATETISSLPLKSNYHIKFSTEREFLTRVQAGEDFESWCVRYGVTLLDRGVWARVQNSSSDVWPRWDIKVVHATRRLLLASQLLGLGDHAAAREELIFVLGHIARSLLLKTGVFPLSRPELAEQVRRIDYGPLADLHERLRKSDSPLISDLSMAILYSKGGYSLDSGSRYWLWWASWAVAAVA